jgi:hypothetical protein
MLLVVGRKVKEIQRKSSKVVTKLLKMLSLLAEAVVLYLSTLMSHTVARQGAFWHSLVLTDAAEVASQVCFGSTYSHHQIKDN